MSAVARNYPVKDYQLMGKPLSFGGITIQLCAMPRRLHTDGSIRYMKQKTHLPRGQQFYPFKLGYKVVEVKEFVKIADIYKFLRWQLLYEKKLRLLNEKGAIAFIKENERWNKSHLQPVADILAVGKTDLQISAEKILERG